MNQEELTFGYSITDDCRIAAPLAERLRHSRASLSLRWLERTASRVTVDANEIYPTQDLLDHVPLLVEAMANYLENPTEEGPAAEQVIAKAAELGEMRFEQGFSPYQILKEFEVLGGIVLSYLALVSDGTGMDCPPREFLICAQRIHRSLALIQQATTARYLTMVETHASEREQRLRAVNDLLEGPLRARLDETIAATRDLNFADPQAFALDLRAQLDALDSALEQVRMLSAVSASARMQRNVPLKAAIGEAIRNLRDTAHERGVDIRMPGELPDIEVNAGAVELSVMVFLTALLRYGQPRGQRRTIEITALGGGVGDDSMIQVSVRDTGAVMPEAVRRALEEGHPVRETLTDSSPPGVSLPIAREAIEALGGRVVLRVDETGTEFVLDLPSRRLADR